MKSYSSYKQIDAGWISSLPAHWSALPVKYVCTYNDDVLAESTEADAPIEYVEISDVDEINGLKGSEIIAFKDAPSRARRLVRDGDIIISTVRTYLRAVAPIKQPPENLVVSTGFAVVRPEGLMPGFARYALVADGFVGSVIARSTGVSYPAINASDLVRIPIPVPPADEQLAIATYLDAETARIDGLIEAKANLHALLRGFDSTAFFSALSARANGKPGRPDDQVRWLASLPASWNRCKIKHVVLAFDQGVSPQCESRIPDDGEWGVLKVGCVNTGRFDPMESKALPPEITPVPEVTVDEGDLLVSRANTKDLVGRSAVATRSFPRLMLSDKIYRLKLDGNRCIPEFVRRLMWIPAVRQMIEERATGASPSMLNIDRRTILELPIPLPAVDEQSEILLEAEAANSASQDLIRHVEREIELLRELRSATITDAVLGRIDVRSQTKH